MLSSKALFSEKLTTELSSTPINDAFDRFDALRLIKVMSVKPVAIGLTVVAKPVKYADSEGWENKFFKGTQLIGMASTADFKGKKNSFLHGVEIMEPFRHMGYGNVIVSYMIAKYKVDTLYVEPDNSGAVRLYRNHGFKVVDWLMQNNVSFAVMRRTQGWLK